jgi:hypothetical protein
MEIIHQSQLPLVGMSHEFIGADHGRVDISFFLVTTAEPGRGVRLHKHDYDEIVYIIATVRNVLSAIRNTRHPQVMSSS